ncbi:hypothetical protein BH10PSE1_BH10PSE1_09050 [soil metagenome]
MPYLSAVGACCAMQAGCLYSAAESHMAKSPVKAPKALAPKRPKKRDRLIHVSTDLFATKGYETTSMQDIAEALGVLKGSLYHYVDSKETILFQIIQETYQLGLENVRSVPDDLEAETRIRLLVDRHLSFLLKNLNASRVLLHEAGALSGDYRKTVDRQRAEYTSAFRQAILDGQTAGVFSEALNVDYACNFMLGACNWVYRWHDHVAVASGSPLHIQFADMVVASLTLPSSR